MNETILKLENITKIYSNGVVANRDINIEFRKGEIHSIVGENGAFSEYNKDRKSTRLNSSHW